MSHRETAKAVKHPRSVRPGASEVTAPELRMQFAQAAAVAAVLRVEVLAVLEALAESEVRLQRDYKGVPAACASVLDRADVPVQIRRKAGKK